MRVSHPRQYACSDSPGAAIPCVPHRALIKYVKWMIGVENYKPYLNCSLKSSCGRARTNASISMKRKSSNQYTFVHITAGERPVPAVHNIIFAQFWKNVQRCKAEYVTSPSSVVGVPPIFVYRTRFSDWHFSKWFQHDLAQDWEHVTGIKLSMRIHDRVELHIFFNCPFTQFSFETNTQSNEDVEI